MDTHPALPLSFQGLNRRGNRRFVLVPHLEMWLANFLLALCLQSGHRDLCGPQRTRRGKAHPGFCSSFRRTLKKEKGNDRAELDGPLRRVRNIGERESCCLITCTCDTQGHGRIYSTEPLPPESHPADSSTSALSPRTGALSLVRFNAGDSTSATGGPTSAIGEQVPVYNFAHLTAR